MDVIRDVPPTIPGAAAVLPPAHQTGQTPEQRAAEILQEGAVFSSSNSEAGSTPPPAAFAQQQFAADQSQTQSQSQSQEVPELSVKKQVAAAVLRAEKVLYPHITAPLHSVKKSEMTKIVFVCHADNLKSKKKTKDYVPPAAGAAPPGEDGAAAAAAAPQMDTPACSFRVRATLRKSSTDGAFTVTVCNLTHTCQGAQGQGQAQAQGTTKRATRRNSCMSVLQAVDPTLNTFTVPNPNPEGSKFRGAASAMQAHFTGAEGTAHITSWQARRHANSLAKGHTLYRAAKRVKAVGATAVKPGEGAKAGQQQRQQQTSVMQQGDAGGLPDHSAHMQMPPAPSPSVQEAAAAAAAAAAEQVGPLQAVPPMMPPAVPVGPVPVVLPSAVAHAPPPVVPSVLAVPAAIPEVSLRGQHMPLGSRSNENSAAAASSSTGHGGGWQPVGAGGGGVPGVR